MNIAVVVSDFNTEVTSRMLQVALERAKRLGITVLHTSHVPGAHDMPLVVDVLLGYASVDAVVTLGAVIRGQTKHDEVISHSVSRALTELSLKHRKPVSLGITGPGMSERQAHARIRPVAERAVETVVTVRDAIGAADAALREGARESGV